MADVPFVRGLNASARFFFNGPEVVVQFKDWSITPNVTDVTDDVGGEDRSRLDRVINFFEFSGTIFTRDSKLIAAYLADIANDDTAVSPLPKAASYKMKIRDGTKYACVMKEMTWASLAINMGARTDALMAPIKLRFRYLDPVQAV